jgi:hypothetical protein
VTDGRNGVVTDSERPGDLADANSLAEELDNGSVYVRALRKKALAGELAPSLCTRQRVQNLLRKKRRRGRNLLGASGNEAVVWSRHQGPVFG